MRHSPTSAGVQVRRLSYGFSPHHVGELRQAESSRGIVMILHGGFWRSHRTLDMTAPMAEALTLRGFDTWNVEYRRGSRGTWSETLSDVAAAFDHIEALADEYSLNTERILLFGHSAGGHLAAWCAGRSATASRHGATPPPLPVHGLVTAGAVLDLAAGAREGIGEDAVVEFLDGGPEDVPERYAEADPVRRVPTNVPTYCVHSAKDERVPFGQSVRYLRAARQAGDDISLIAARGNHTDCITVGHIDFELVVHGLEELASMAHGTRVGTHRRAPIHLRDRPASWRCRAVC